MSQTKNVRIKICFVGDANVGKTSLIGRYVHNVFGDKYLSTLGTKVSRKDIDIEYPHEDTSVRMDAMIWDIMGQNTFRSLFSESYFQGANGIIGVCNLTEAESLYSLNEWIHTARTIAGDIPVIVLANKCDLKEDIKLTPKEIKEIAAEWNAKYLLTSAKSGDNVNQGFLTISRDIISDKFDLA
jgi:Ras-related protein Rab-8A